MAAGTTTLQRLLDQATYQQPEVYSELLQAACERLRLLAHRRLISFPSLKRWLDTDDLLQNALVRLHRSLNQIKPATVQAFFGLAALQIRRELLDLNRSIFGPQGIGANHHTDGVVESGSSIIVMAPAMPTNWERFHQMTDDLPDEEKQVVDLLFIHEMTQEEAAIVLGISHRTVKRRWLAAKMRLGELLQADQDIVNE